MNHDDPSTGFDGDRPVSVCHPVSSEELDILLSLESDPDAERGSAWAQAAAALRTMVDWFVATDKPSTKVLLVHSLLNGLCVADVARKHGITKQAIAQYLPALKAMGIPQFRNNRSQESCKNMARSFEERRK